MKFSSPSSRAHQVLIDITPMIDVVFLLIVFFMTTAQFVQTTRAELDLPQEPGEQQDQPDEAGLVINITSENEIIISQQLVDLEDVDSLVKREIERLESAQAQQVKLLIRADRNANAAMLNKVLRRLENRGVGVARLATHPPRN